MYSLWFFLVFIYAITDGAIVTNRSAQSPQNDLITFQEEKLVEQSRRRKGGQNDMMSNILPMMVMPFMVSTGMIPMMLVSLKAMLIQSAFIGKIAIILMLINMFRGRNQGGGVFTHNLSANQDAEKKNLALMHYGYGDNTEFGAYVHNRR